MLRHACWVIALACPAGGGAIAQGVVEPGATLRKLAGDFSFTEGPAANRRGDVCFTDQPNDRIMVWTVEGELRTFQSPSGRANGLCFDSRDRLWICADEKNELRVFDPRSKKPAEPCVGTFDGKLLNGPNDVWVRPDGGVYFTDPFYRRPYWKHAAMPQDVQAVYYVVPGGKRAARVADDLRQPNGIIGTPDGKTLYVADIGASKTYAYTIRKDGTLADKRLFCEMGSDGMTIDSVGNVYLTGRGVTVYSAKGERIDQIAVPEEGWTANVCFGGSDRRTLFITAGKGLYAIRTRTKGVGSQ